MKLYYTKAACSLVVRIILNEIGVKFETEKVDLKAKTYQSDKDFRKINPKGSVPALELDNGDILTENTVILQYLANTFNKNTLLPALNNFDHYRVLESLNFITTELHKGFSPLFNPAIPDETKEQVFKPLLKTKFTYINQCLQHHQYLNGNDFTLADAYLYVMIRWAIAYKIPLHDLSHLPQYLTRLNLKESIKISLEQEQLSMMTIDVSKGSPID